MSFLAMITKPCRCWLYDHSVGCTRAWFSISAISTNILTREWHHRLRLLPVHLDPEDPRLHRQPRPHELLVAEALELRHRLHRLVVVRPALLLRVHDLLPVARVLQQLELLLRVQQRELVEVVREDVDVRPEKRPSTLLLLQNRESHHRVSEVVQTRLLLLQSPRQARDLQRVLVRDQQVVRHVQQRVALLIQVTYHKYTKIFFIAAAPLKFLKKYTISIFGSSAPPFFSQFTRLSIFTFSGSSSGSS